MVLSRTISLIFFRHVQCACMYICVSVTVHKCAGANVSACMFKALGSHWVSSLIKLFLEAGSLNTKLIDSSYLRSWIALEILSDSSVMCVTSQVHLACTWFLWSQLSPHACTRCSSATEPPPQHHFHMVCVCEYVSVCVCVYVCVCVCVSACVWQKCVCRRIGGGVETEGVSQGDRETW